jgi:hypothetical protein
VQEEKGKERDEDEDEDEDEECNGRRGLDVWTKQII